MEIDKLVQEIKAIAAKFSISYTEALTTYKLIKKGDYLDSFMEKNGYSILSSSQDCVDRDQLVDEYKKFGGVGNLDSLLSKRGCPRVSKNGKNYYIFIRKGGF